VRKRLSDTSKEIVFAGDEGQPPFISVAELKELKHLMELSTQKDAENCEEGIEREEDHGSISFRNEPSVKRKQPMNVMLEKLVTCFITPLLSRAVGGSTQVVNSETLSWLQKKAGDPEKKWLKPDLWGSHVPSVITRKETWDPPSNATASTKQWMNDARTEHKMIQGRMHMKVLDLIAFLVEIKLSLGDRTKDSFKDCEGQIMEYLMVVSGATGGVCSGMLFALDGVILYEATNGRIERITSFEPCTPGGRAEVHRCLNMHKSPWVSAIAGCETALGVKVTGFVEAGGNGRVFSVVENKSSEKFAMKIVLGSAADKLPAERASLYELKSSGVVPTVYSEVFTAPQTTGNDGAVIPMYTAFLMDLGEPITRFNNSDITTAFKHLHVIHDAGKTHGDPRFPDNLIRKGQSLMWVDFFPVPPDKQPSCVEDVVILVFSICRGGLESHSDVGNLLKDYDNHRSLENMLKISKYVTAAHKQS
jgi:hypothetical protein